MFGKDHKGKKNPHFGAPGLCGKENPNWRGGLCYYPYTAEFSNKLRQKIRKRDKVCQICGRTKEEEGQNLAVHHIDHIKKNCSEDNLIALCKSCNSKCNFNVDYWIKFLREKLGPIV